MSTLSIFNPDFSSDLFDFFNEAANYRPTRNVNLPSVDIIETKDNYTFEMELCGLSENDVELSIKERVLTVESKKNETVNNKDDKKLLENKSENKEMGKRYLLNERRKYSFKRQFTLPQDVDVENVSANFMNGLLTISVPKKPEAELKHIKINVA
jgi:HSP20 family protein